MATHKTVHLIHGQDADQHLGHLKDILEAMKTENRIDGYSDLDIDTINEKSFGALRPNDMIIFMLSTSVADKKSEIEDILLQAKQKNPETRVVEILVDNLTYEPDFIALPQNLEPIRSEGDMDAVWKQIGATLRDIFPVIEVGEKKAFEWKKYLPYAIGALLIIILFIIFSGGNDDIITEPPKGDSKITFIKAVLNSAKNVEGKCPHEFKFQGNIGVNGPMKIEYAWIDSEGNSSDTETYEFTEADTIQVKTSWEVGTNNKDYHGWKSLKIVSPTEQESNKAEFNLRCKNSSTIPEPEEPRGPEPEKDKFEVTNIDVGANPTNFSGVCPTTVLFGAKVTVNGPGKIRYTWIQSDKSQSKPEILEFSEAGSKILRTQWKIGSAGDKLEGWQQLKIISPNEMVSNRAVFSLNCVTTEDQVKFDVILKAVGQSKLTVIKLVKELTGLGLKESKQIVDGAPIAVKEDLSKDEAESLKNQLEQTGAEVEIKEHRTHIIRKIPGVLIVEDIFSMAGRGTVATGKVAQGIFKTGDKISINGGKTTICTGIVKFGKFVDNTSKGEAVGILLRGISTSDIKKGDKLAVVN